MKDFNEISQYLTQSKAEVMQDHLKKSNYIFKLSHAMTDYLLQLSCVLFLQDLEVKEHNDFFF